MKGMRRAIIGSGIFGFACAVAFGQTATEGNLVFEVASVKPHVAGAPGSTGRTGIEEDPGQIRIENLSLRTLIAISYGVKGSEQLAGPGWLSTIAFDIVAKPPAGYKHEQLQFLVRNLLADRFKLTVHHETKPISAFALVIAKGGFKLHEAAGPRTYLTVRSGLIEGKQRSIAELAGGLTRVLGRPVLDQTGLGAMYDLKLEWTPDAPPPIPGGAETGSADEPGLSLFTALQEQLGLRLESRKVPGDVVVVDRVEKVPSEN
jgi:uncharacterized protein (TIGR03435 family)